MITLEHVMLAVGVALALVLGIVGWLDHPLQFFSGAW